jgi:hypothetical protein
MKDYSEYTATVKTDESYYGDCSRSEALDIAAKITAALAEKFPGIEIRQCPMIGRGDQDETAGPEQSVCYEIDLIAEQAMESALAN